MPHPLNKSSVRAPVGLRHAVWVPQYDIDNNAMYLCMSCAVTSLLFEKYDVPGMFLHPSSVLSLYSVGHTTGVVVDCGASAARIVPVYEGYGIDMAVQSLPIGGSRLADHFVRMLTERGHYMTTSAQQDMAREMEEQLCYVAKDFEALSADTKSHEEKTYVGCACCAVYSPYSQVHNVWCGVVWCGGWGSFTLPDGTKYTIGDERFRLPEVRALRRGTRRLCSTMW